MIRLMYAGHFGNNLFNYALARYLAEETGHALQCRQTTSTGNWAQVELRSRVVDKLTDHWSIFEDAPQELPGVVIEQPQLRFVMGEKLTWHGQSLNLPELLRQAPHCRVVLHGYFQRTEYYLPYADRIRRWFRLRELELPVVPRKRDVIVHVRRSLDMRLLDRRLDVSFYTDALRELSPERVFVCGLGIDETFRKAVERFQPQYLELDAARTLCLMTKFNNIIMANSTFSWWGAFLSEAERIVFPIPVRGFMSPDCAEVDLRVPESRYRYVEDAALEPWRFLRRGKQIQLSSARGASTMQLADGRSIALPSRVLGELARWIQRVDGDFGLDELHRAGFGPSPPLLAALRRFVEVGVLETCDAHPEDPPFNELMSGAYPFGLS